MCRKQIAIACQEDIGSTVASEIGAEAWSAATEPDRIAAVTLWKIAGSLLATQVGTRIL